MKTSNNKTTTKITKILLVIYCFIELVSLVILFSLSYVYKDLSFLYAFLLCLISNFFYFAVSIFVPNAISSFKSKTHGIVFSSILFSLKYITLIGILVIGVVFNQYFNKWVILTFTIWPPVYVVIYKIFFANKVSKISKKDSKI